MYPSAGQIWKLDGHTILLYKTSSRGWLRSMAIYGVSPRGYSWFGRPVVPFKGTKLRFELQSRGQYIANLEVALAMLDEPKSTTTI